MTDQGRYQMRDASPHCKLPSWISGASLASDGICLPVHLAHLRLAPQLYFWAQAAWFPLLISTQHWRSSQNPLGVLTCSFSFPPLSLATLSGLLLADMLARSDRPSAPPLCSPGFPPRVAANLGALVRYGDERNGLRPRRRVTDPLELPT